MRSAPPEPWMVSARSVPRNTSPAFVPGIVAASAAPEPTPTIANEAAATLTPLTFLFCAISVPFRLGARPGCPWGPPIGPPALALRADFRPPREPRHHANELVF